MNRRLDRTRINYTMIWLYNWELPKFVWLGWYIVADYRKQLCYVPPNTAPISQHQSVNVSILVCPYFVFNIITTRSASERWCRSLWPHIFVSYNKRTRIIFITMIGCHKTIYSCHTSTRRGIRRVAATARWLISHHLPRNTCKLQTNMPTYLGVLFFNARRSVWSD